MTQRRTSWMGLAGIILAACGSKDDSGDGGGSSAEDSALIGLYQLDRWELAACGAEAGESQLPDGGAWAEVHADSFFGASMLAMVVCEDRATCEASARGDSVMPLAAVVFTTGSDDAGWDGELAWAMSDGSDTCTGQVDRSHVDPTADGLLATNEHSEEFSFPPDDEGTCWTDDADAASAGAACDSLEIFAATRLAD